MRTTDDINNYTSRKPQIHWNSPGGPEQPYISIYLLLSYFIEIGLIITRKGCFWGRKAGKFWEHAVPDGEVNKVS
jgi:hypothetical protein